MALTNHNHRLKKPGYITFPTIQISKYSGESMPPTPWIGSLQQTFTRTPVQYILEPLQVGKDSEGGFACVNIQSCFKFKPGCIS